MRYAYFVCFVKFGTLNVNSCIINTGLSWIHVREYCKKKKKDIRTKEQAEKYCERKGMEMIPFKGTLGVLVGAKVIFKEEHREAAIKQKLATHENKGDSKVAHAKNSKYIEGQQKSQKVYDSSETSSSPQSVSVSGRWYVIRHAPGNSPAQMH